MTVTKSYNAAGMRHKLFQALFFWLKFKFGQWISFYLTLALFIFKIIPSLSGYVHYICHYSSFYKFFLISFNRSVYKIDFQPCMKSLSHSLFGWKYIFKLNSWRRIRFFLVGIKHYKSILQRHGIYFLNDRG